MRCCLTFVCLAWATHCHSVTSGLLLEDQSNESSDLNQSRPAVDDGPPGRDVVSDAMWYTDRALDKALPMIPARYRREVLYYGRSVLFFFELLVLPELIAKLGGWALKNAVVVIRVLVLHLFPIYMLFCAAQDDGNCGSRGILWSMVLYAYCAAHALLLAMHARAAFLDWEIDAQEKEMMPFTTELHPKALLGYIFAPVFVLSLTFGFTKPKGMSQPSRIDISALCFAMGMLPAEWAVSNVVVYVWIHDIRFGVPVPPAEMMAALAFVGAFYVGWSFAAFWFFQFMDQVLVACITPYPSERAVAVRAQE